MFLRYVKDMMEEYSEKFLELVDSLNKEFGVNFVLPADEYFIKAGRPFKPMEFYGEFEQIENGIGMTRKFIFDFEDELSRIVNGEKISLKKPKNSLIISGVSAKTVNRELAQAAMERVDGLSVEILAIENDFFGKTVTCTGLLTGKDILKAVQDYQKTADFDELILPGNTLKEFEDVFLCGMTVKELKKSAKIKKLRVNRDGGRGLARVLAERK